MKRNSLRTLRISPLMSSFIITLFTMMHSYASTEMPPADDGPEKKITEESYEETYEHEYSPHVLQLVENKKKKKKQEQEKQKNLVLKRLRDARSQPTSEEQIEQSDVENSKEKDR